MAQSPADAHGEQENEPQAQPADVLGEVNGFKVESKVRSQVHFRSA